MANGQKGNKLLDIIAQIVIGGGSVITMVIMFIYADELGDGNIEKEFRENGKMGSAKAESRKQQEGQQLHLRFVPPRRRSDCWCGRERQNPYRTQNPNRDQRVQVNAADL